MIAGAGGPMMWGGGPDWHGPNAHEPRRMVIDGRVFDPRVMRRLWGYVRPYKAQVFITLLMIVISSAMQLLGPYLLKIAIDNYIVETTDVVGLSVVSIFFAGTLVVSYLTQSSQTWLMA